MKAPLIALLCALMPEMVQAGCRDVREITMAESAVFWALVASSSAEARAACASTPLACSDDRGDLGLSLIAAKAAVLGPEKLTPVLRYQIDGGLSESYTCHVLNTGPGMIEPLIRLDAAALQAECKREFEVAARGNQKIFAGVELSAVCASRGEIKNRVNQLVVGLGSGERCSDGDF